MSGQCRLDFGPLDLVSADGDAGDYRFGVIGEDVQFGQPQPVETSVASLMADGSPTNTTRWENREAGFQVTIEAADSQGLADGEAALAALIGTRTTLTWQPPDNYGPASVFEVETSSMEFLFSDFDEIRAQKRRTYRLRLVCLPWVRSANPITFGASPVSDTVTVVDECESTSGWSVVSPYSGTVSVDTTSGNYMSGTGSIKKAAEFRGALDSAGVGLASTNLKKSVSISAAGGGFLVVRIKPSTGTFWSYGAGTFYLTTSASGRVNVTPQSVTADQNGFFRFVFAFPDASTVTEVDMLVYQTAQSVPGSFWFDAIGTSAVNAAARQQVFSFDVKGSARSEGTLAVSSSTGLGDVLLYTTPDLGDGFRPDLKRWLTSGASTSDSNAVTGSRVAITSDSGSPKVVMEAPVSMFRAGCHAMLARVIASGVTSGTLTVAAQLVSGSTLVGAEVRTNYALSLNDTNYHLLTVGTLDLPPLVVDAASGMKIRFSVYYSQGGVLSLDELLAFPLDESALTWVTCGTGTPSVTVASRVWLDAPSPAKPRGVLLTGTASDRSDARAVVPASRGRHLLVPGRMIAYLMSSGSGGSLSGSYFPRWHSNAGL